MWRDAPRHASPNAGWPEAAMAGALGVELGGAATYEGVLHERPLFGAGRRPDAGDVCAGAADLSRSVRAALGARAGVGRRSAAVAALMIQGCGSDVGKSLLVAGLCRLLTNRGKVVRPFKPQNMSNNAAVTADGGEIGRSTALQALACRTPPTVDMNPVLLKPQSRHRPRNSSCAVGASGRGTRTRSRGTEATCCRSRVDSFRRAAARSRHRHRRRRGQSGGNEPARARHRQHGLRARGRTCRSCSSATSIAVT